MKIYFTGSTIGKKRLSEEYQAIAIALAGLGHKVTTKILDSSSSFKSNGGIKSADLIVAEITHPSLIVGQEIAAALGANKPVLALYLEGQESGFPEIEENQKLQIVAYRKDNLKDVLGSAIKAAADKGDVRFNFFVHPEIVDYLNWVAKEKRVPRSVYLRNLIEKEMKTNSEYRKEIEDK